MSQSKLIYFFDVKHNTHSLIDSRLVLKCGLAHLMTNARDKSNANAQHLNHMQIITLRFKFS